MRNCLNYYDYFETAVYIVPKCVRKRGGKNSANIECVEEIADILRFPKWYDT